MSDQQIRFIERVVRRVEWTGAPDGRNVCPWCGNFQHEGHKNNCQRQAALIILARQ